MWGNRAFGGRRFDFFSVADVTVIFYCRVQTSPTVLYGKDVSTPDNPEWWSSGIFSATSFLFNNPFYSTINAEEVETNNYCWSDFYFLVFWRSWKLFKFALNMVHVTVEWWKNKNVVCVHLQTPLSFFFSLQFIQSIAFYWSFMHYDAEVTSGRSTRMWGNRAFGGRRFNFFFCGRCNSYLLLSGPDVPVGISLMS